MAKIELGYIESDGLFYPYIETDMENIESDLGKYGNLRQWYLHEHKPKIYRELLLTGKLAQHCKAFEEMTLENLSPQQFQMLTPELMREFIDKIVVHERSEP